MALPFAAHMDGVSRTGFVAAPSTFEVVRYFNTAAPCYPELHYRVPAGQRLPEARPRAILSRGRAAPGTAILFLDTRGGATDDG
jgi:hypothetical protein